MTTSYDLAILAEDVYSQENNDLAASEGWEREDGMSWLDGFAAGTYRKGDRTVVAFRGTDDVVDAISDARMVPAASTSQIAGVTPAVLSEYGLADRPELLMGGALLTQILIHRRTRAAIQTYANQVPPQQTRQAEEYLDARSAAPAYLTGHSLGGALAKVMTLRRGIPCVAFNSPFMGRLRGVPSVSSAALLSINAKGDPLSLATREVGNLPHGRTIVVETGPSPHRPPVEPEVESYRRPVECPRASGTWWNSEEGIMAAVAGPVCEVAMDAWEPVGRALSAPRRHLRYWYRQYPSYVASLLTYLGDVALYVHGMANLRRKMAEQGRFRTALD